MNVMSQHFSSVRSGKKQKTKGETSSANMTSMWGRSHTQINTILNEFLATAQNAMNTVSLEHTSACNQHVSLELYKNVNLKVTQDEACRTPWEMKARSHITVSTEKQQKWKMSKS